MSSVKSKKTLLENAYSNVSDKKTIKIISKCINEMRDNEDYILPVKERVKITSPLLRTTFGSSNMYRVGVHAEGSCFFHSILYSYSQEYRDSTPNQQLNLGHRFRKLIANKLSKYYSSLGFAEAGILEEDLYCELINTGSFVGEETWVLISLILNINVIVLRKDSIYCGAGNFDSNNPTFVVINIEDKHYEPVIQVKSSGRVVSQFTKKSRPIVKLKKLYNRECVRAY